MESHMRTFTQKIVTLDSMESRRVPFLLSSMLKISKLDERLRFRFGSSILREYNPSLSSRPDLFLLTTVARSKRKAKKVSILIIEEDNGANLSFIFRSLDTSRTKNQTLRYGLLLAASSDLMWIPAAMHIYL